MTTFREGQDVAVVEHENGQPVRNGRVMWATITQAGPCSVHATCGADDTPRMFLLDSAGRAWNAAGKWRLVALCYFCGEPVTGEPVTGEPVTGEPVTDKGDPEHREWDSEDCREASAEAWAGQHYPSGVST